MNSDTTHQTDTADIEADLIQDAFDTLDYGIAIFDKDTRLITWNRCYSDMFPLVQDKIVKGIHWEVLQRACMETGQIIDPFDDPSIFINRARGNLTNFERDVVAQHAGGKSYRVSFKPTRSGGYIVTRRENAPSEQADMMVRDRENLLATVLDTIPISVTMTQLEGGQIIYRSQCARGMFGDTSNATEQYASSSEREAYVSELKKHGTVNGYQALLKGKHNNVFPAIMSGRIVEHGAQQCIVTAIGDISEQMERDALVRQVLESCTTPIQMSDAETGKVLFSSPEMIALLGQVENAKSTYVDMKDRKRQLDQLHVTGVTREHRSQYYDKNRNVFWGAVSAKLISYEGRDVIVSHTRDMTEQLKIEAELTGQREQLFQNEKMSALGELLAGVAHELNNPLSVVVGHSLMLREDTQEPDVLRQVEKISAAAERCAGIVKTFLTMARQQPSKSEETNINEIVRIAVDVARHGDLDEGIEIECDLTPSLPRCDADGDQITQVVLNLILNAEHAIQDSGKGDKISVRTGFDAQAGMIRINVEDNGPGIPKKIQSRIFEPFFSTKDVGDGTGIGLSLSHRIMSSHNGQITLDRKFRSGSRFDVLIPALLSEPRSPDSGQVTSALQKDMTRILIVDDERDVADLNGEILTRGGFKVDVANTATDGIALMRSNSYDLVLSDLNMPEMDGRGFFDTIRENFPQLIDRIGFITGDTMGKSSQTFLKDAQRPYLEKPASPKELRQFVADILRDVETGI